MKVPGDLLKGMSGDKRRGLTVFSLVAIVFACISGIVWGLIAVLNPGKPIEWIPPCSEKHTIDAKLNKETEKLADPGCRACGGG